MKRIHRLIIIVLTLCFGFYSCQKELTDPNGSSTTTGGTGDFRAKINGTQWIASSASANRGSGVIALAGIGGGKTMVITLQDSGVHHYTLDLTSLQAAALVDSSSGNTNAFATNQGSSSLQSGGSVDITSIDTANKKINGTFRFVVYRALDSAQRNITEGSFTNISYATAPPPASPTDTFNVKIDGVTFTPITIVGIRLTASSQITLSGSAGAKSVTLIFPDNITPGTYPITTVGGTYSGLYNQDATTFLPSDSGSLTILQHNTSTKRIRGNFNFHAKQFLLGTAQAQLTAGVFAVTYQ